MAKGDNKKGIENLIPFNELAEEQQREIARKGAYAAAEAKREKKKLKDSIIALLELSDETGLNNQEKLIKALFDKASKGDVPAFIALRDTAGEKPNDVLELPNLTTERIKFVD